MAPFYFKVQMRKSSNEQQTMTFYLLALSILCVFPFCKISIMKQPLWLFLMVVSIISACLEAYIDLYGVISIVFYVALYQGSIKVKRPVLSPILSTAFIVMSLALALHYIPGFNNLPIVVNQQITHDAIAYTLYANIDKAIAGLFLTAYFFEGLNSKAEIANNKQPIKAISKIPLKQPVLIILATILATLTTALALGIVNINPKIPDFWLAFITINLFFTCVAEEALFRGLIQHKISQLIKSSRFILIAPVVTACIFALAHFIAGLNYVLVSAVAGLGYGYIFYKTKRLEWAILCHWLVNVCHFFWFTYPILKSQL